MALCRQAVHHRPHWRSVAPLRMNIRSSSPLRVRHSRAERSTASRSAASALGPVTYVEMRRAATLSSDLALMRARCRRCTRQGTCPLQRNLSRNPSHAASQKTRLHPSEYPAAVVSAGGYAKNRTPVYFSGHENSMGAVQAVAGSPHFQQTLSGSHITT